MPFMEINAARLFYEVFGTEHRKATPIVLIHSACKTGRADWGTVAPLLARQYQVFVPDCRGHGQSTNPTRSYSFREMAADIAALVRALGYSQAHIIGHSNGGNVALVTLMEHPEVVQSAVLQAANAYVSQDLIDREPVVFDPERVARENPAWIEEMTALHGPTHGTDYWRRLLEITLQEIITEPNYTPEDLRRVRQPVLVIQGEKDSVNAPARHAQFIAQHIPEAELWAPEETGHNVHDERLFEWIERVSSFLDHRGEEPNDLLYRLGCQRFKDRRETIFNLRASSSVTTTGAHKIRLAGEVLTRAQLQAAHASLAASQIDEVEDDVSILLTEQTAWGLVNRGVTDLRGEPDNHSGRLSQALLGEALRTLEEHGEWTRVRLEKDGYLGWMHSRALTPLEPDEISNYQTKCNTVIIAGLAQAYTSPPSAALPASPTGTLPGERGSHEAGKIPFGVKTIAQEQKDSWTAIQLPDGRRWWVHTGDLLPLDRLPQPDPQGISYTISLLQRFIGVPYLWGGRTPFGYDCSGFAQTFLIFLGVNAPRDADQQHEAATLVQGRPQAGDLLFFGSADQGSHRPISHVAISLGGDEMIHANGTAWGVSYNSLDPHSPLYNHWLLENLVSVGRFW